jgi:hypothetical protein
MIAPPRRRALAPPLRRTLGGLAAPRIAVAERIFLLNRPKYVRQVPAYLDAAHGGLVLCDANAGAGVIALRKSGYTGVLVEDVAAYETEVATADEPFSLSPSPPYSVMILRAFCRISLTAGRASRLPPPDMSQPEHQTP